MTSAARAIRRQIIGAGLFLVGSWVALFMVAIYLLGDIDRQFSVSLEAARAESSMLQLRRHEKDFLQRFEMRYRSEFEAEMVVLRSSLAALASHMALGVDEYADLRSRANDYETSFGRLVGLWRELGLNQDFGLHGELRRVAHQLEAGLVDPGDRMALLQLRRREKDFLQRFELRYVDLFDGIVARYLEADPSSRDAGENTLRPLWRQYAGSFHEIVALAQQIGLDQDSGIHGEMRRSIHGLEPVLASIGSKTKAAAADRVGDLAVELLLVFVFFALCSVAGLWRLRSVLLKQQGITEQLASQEERLRVTLGSIGDAVITTDMSGRVDYLNGVAEKLTGWDRALACGRDIGEVFKIVNADSRQPVPIPHDEVIRSGRVVGLANHTVLISRSGQEFQIADSAAPIFDPAHEMQGVVLVFQDVTERYELEERVRHGQKIESLAILSGGIAHDFNNLLTGILNAAELLSMREEREEQDSEAADLIEVITRCGQQAAELTGQLLSFSRRGRLLSAAVVVRDTLQDTVKILERSLDKRVDLEVSWDADEGMVLGDSSQLGGVFLNLAVNAGEAMPDGGRLRITGSNRRFDESDCHATGFDLTPGEYLEVSFADEGVGMSPETVRRAFEPFYTTKQQGTGLGLASAFGVVRQHGGLLTVSSRLGEGSVFRVLLPVLDVAEAAAVEIGHGSVGVDECGVVLVVDDEEVVRATTRTMLESMGFECDVAEDGKRAIACLRDNPERFDAVLLDLVLPDCRGSEIFHEMRSIREDLPIVVFSGFPGEADLESLLSHSMYEFLNKPFTRVELRSAIAKVRGAWKDRSGPVA